MELGEAEPGEAEPDAASDGALDMVPGRGGLELLVGNKGGAGVEVVVSPEGYCESGPVTGSPVALCWVVGADINREVDVAAVALTCDGMLVVCVACERREAASLVKVAPMAWADACSEAAS